MVPPSGEREAVPELEQQRLDVLDEGVLEVAFVDRAGQVEKVHDVGSRVSCLASSLSPAGSWAGKLEGAAPTRRCSWFMSCCWSTLRDQPCLTAAAAYQSRSARSSSLSSRTVTWPQGSCQTAYWTIASSPQAAASPRV